MADPANITRRAAFASIGALVSTAAVAVPVAAKVTEPAPFDLQRWLDTAEPREAMEYHAIHLAKLCCKLRPGLWRYNLEHVVQPASGVVLFHYESHPTFVGIQQTFY